MTNLHVCFLFNILNKIGRRYFFILELLESSFSVFGTSCITKLNAESICKSKLRPVHYILGILTH